ncbi:MAG: pyridoxamine 5'-phosphate oxidase family protein [Methylococcus sp.]
MLTPPMQAAIERAELLPLATASLTGIPNVVPVKFVWVAAPDTLWIADNYLDKTLANLRENPRAALYVWSADPKLCVQIKGDIAIHTEGRDYETMKAQARAEKPDLPARSLVVLHIREIYQCLPGDGPGRRLWPPVGAAPAGGAP